MGELRPSSGKPYDYGGGRNTEIIVEDASKTVKKLYISRCRPRFDLNTSYDRNCINFREIKIKTPRKPSSAMGMAWWNGPDIKRRKRIAKYKYYAVEGKVKSSLGKGFHWFKTKCSKAINSL